MIDRILNLNRLLGKNQSAFLFGPRGVGKTYLCNKFLQTQEHTFEIDLLNYELLTRYVISKGLFLNEVENKIVKNGVLTVYIDEVQKLPHLLDEVHLLIEKYKEKIRFIITGSSARKLKRGGANQLAGRAWTLKLHPLSFIETDIDIKKALKWGTLPAIYTGKENIELALKSYVETYLKEEILQEALVRNGESFMRFLDVAGQMNGEPVNFSKIAKESAVSIKTAQEYFSILVDTFVAFRIDGWSRSVRKQLLQSPKFYFFDCGVLNTIRGELKTELRESSYYYGKLFETLVILEIIRINDYVNSDFRLSYWRTNTGVEVDLVLSRGIKEPPIAIEIKSQRVTAEKDLHGLKSFESEHPNAILYCFSNSSRQYKIGDITIFPWREGIKKIFYK